MSSVWWPTGAANWQAQQISRTERRETSQGSSYSHSWWWDSHNAPRNSKWLEDNLNEMDAKVKAMLKLIDEDADSFAKRAEMYYKKRPELVSLVEEFYRAYRSLAERYDQLTGQVRQIPQEIQVQYGLWGDASPGSPGSGGSFRRRAAGFSAFANTGNPKVSKAKARKRGSDSSSSSSSDSDVDAKHISAQQSDELLGLRLYNEQLKKDLEHAFMHQQAVESRLAEIQGELKSLQQENVQLHQLLTTEKGRIELECADLRDANSKFELELASQRQHAQRVELDLKVAEGAAALSMEEVVKLKVDLVSETHRLKIAQDECFVQEQLVFALQDENARLFARVEELEARDKSLQEELKGLLRTINKLCQEKESYDMDVLVCNDEPSEIEILSKESNVITETISALRIGITKLEIYLSNCTEELQSLQHVRGDYNILLCEHESTVAHLQALRSRNEELESQVGILEQENVKSHEQLLASIKDSDQLTSEMLREKKELYEKLLSEGDHVLKLQKELKLLKEETAGNGRVMDYFQREIERLKLSVQEITVAKDQKEKSLRDELQSHAAKTAVLAKKLNEAHELVSIEKAEVMRLEEENDRKGQLLLKLEADIVLVRANVSEKEELFTSSMTLAEQKVTDLLAQLSVLSQEKENVLSQLHEQVFLCGDQDEKIQKYLWQLKENEVKVEDQMKHSADISQKYGASLGELEALRLQLISLQEENSRLGLDVLARTVSITQLTETISNIENQNADLSVQLKKVQEDDLSLQQYNASLQAEIEHLQQSLKSQSIKIKVFEEEIFKLREVHAKLQTDHECISSEKQRNLDEHIVTLSSLEKLKEQLHHQQNENECVKVELRSRFARIQELETTIVHLEKEKHAFSVEIASTVVLMTDTQKRANALQEEIRRLRQELTSSNEELQEKTDKAKKLLSMCDDLEEQKSALSMEVELKLQAFGSLDASFCALKDEHVSLVDKYEFATKEAAAGANMILKLQGEISQLKSDKEAQIQTLMQRKADIQRLQEDFALVRNSEEQLKKVLDAKVQEVNQLKEELISLKAAKLVFYEEQNQKTKSLEVELKRMELVVIGFRHEKNSLSEQNAIALRRCSDLEATCKRLQQQLGDQNKERERLESQLSLMGELTKEALHDEEMARLMQERVANKQREIEQVQSINEDLKETVRKLESEVESLKAQIMGQQKKNTLLHEELSTKASLVQLLDQSLTSLKEQKIVFEGGIALAVSNLSLVQIEVDKLLQKISKLNELSVAKAEELQIMEGRICQLQVSNLNQREEISGFAKKEKSYIIAVRFMRAEFFCLAQRMKTMKKEKLELARLAEPATNSEKKKNSEAMSGLHQELSFLREENKRQRTIILDRAEEKREAIRQLCATIDHLQNKNRRLERAINSVRDKIQMRIAASRASRR